MILSIFKKIHLPYNIVLFSFTKAPISYGCCDLILFDIQRGSEGGRIAKGINTNLVNTFEISTSKVTYWQIISFTVLHYYLK